MDKFKYEKIVNKLFSDLDSLKESLEVVLSRQYLDENMLDDLSVNVSNKISYIFSRCPIAINNPIIMFITIKYIRGFFKKIYN